MKPSTMRVSSILTGLLPQRNADFSGSQAKATDSERQVVRGNCRVAQLTTHSGHSAGELERQSYEDRSVSKESFQTINRRSWIPLLGKNDAVRWNLGVRSMRGCIGATVCVICMVPMLQKPSYVNQETCMLKKMPFKSYVTYL